MKYVKKSLLSGVVASLLALLLLTRGAAQATTTSTCAWKFVYSPNGTGGSSLYGVAAVSGHDVWAVGQQDGNTLTERWSGSQWSIVPSPNVGSTGSFLRAVTVISTNDVWAVGFSGDIYTNNLIEHWNGSQWSVVPNPTLQPISVLQGASATSSNDVWAVGYTTNEDPDSDVDPVVEHWNGSQWSLIPSPNPTGVATLTGVTAISANNVWVVGYSQADYESPPQSLVEHWDGTQWSIVSNPQPSSSNAFAAISAVSATNIWAVGTSYTSSSGVQPLIEHWDGSSWSIVSSPVLQNSPRLVGVAAVSASNVWAVGSNNGAVLIEHWNGSAWKIAASPPVVGTADFLNAIARVPATSKVWAVGYHSTSTNKVRTLTAFHC